MMHNPNPTKPFAAAKIYHEGSIQTFGASVKAPQSVRMAGGGQASAGAIPPIVTRRVRKEVDALDGGEDFEGGLGVGGEPLLA
jgi:hypothetical protein